MTNGVDLSLVDVDNSFHSFVRERGVKELRARLSAQVLATAASLQRRMSQTAPRGPDAPHIAETVTFTHKGLSAQVGYLKEDFGGEPAGEGNTATIAAVALYNEFKPNAQPYMRPAAEREYGDFVKRMKDAAASMERALALGGGR